MRARNAAVLMLVVLACQANPSPEEWLPTPEATPQWPRGGWIVIDRAVADSTAPRLPLIDGELLAVSPDSGWVLTDQGVEAVAAADVAQATLVGWDPQTEKLGLWTAIGAVSTISNGVILVFTAPMWVIGGSLATASHSRRPVLTTDDDQWLDLRLYARFPQGLPPGLDLASLGKLVR
jgi:hypothetical protein